MVYSKSQNTMWIYIRNGEISVNTDSLIEQTGGDIYNRKFKNVTK